MPQEELVEAYRAIHAPQAHMVAHFLQGAGIPAFVDGEGLTVDLLGWPTSPRVLVPAHKLNHARALIAAAENVDDEPLSEVDDVEE
ncbi:MAG: DUF2007 domain-containing protein [Planctomycetaceae bacterium]|nr:DUF2007 domain-containing protein [Planctomycetaceae bacterium]